MKNNINDRINKLVNDRKILLNLSKECISEDNDSLSEGISNIVDNYNKDSKEYNTIIKAKGMIYQLTQEISCANSIDDIVKLRKKINYYINKIKKELATRNIEQSKFVKIQQEVNSLRNNISKYLRFLKRDNTLKEINRLYDDFENLTKEECSCLKKMISTELRYNKRVLNSNLNNDNKTVDDDNLERNIDDKIVHEDDTKGTVSLEVNTENNVFNFFVVSDEPISSDQSISSDEPTSESIVNSPISNTVIDGSFVDSNSKLSEEYLVSRIDYYKKLYRFNPLLPYDGCMIKNMISFIRNIPKYGKNNRLLRYAVRDYNIFYHGADLDGFIVYSKKRNSVISALATIFKSSHLSKRERELLDNYDKCLDWISEFYDNNCVSEKKLVKTIGV